jgi:nucleotide-binding universal stress UspA family protein
MNVFRHVLVAIDFGSCSDRALDLAMKIIDGTEAKITLMHVCEVPPFVLAGVEFTGADIVGGVIDAAEHAFEEQLVAVRRRAPKAIGVLRQGAAWEEILDVARSSHVDLIVVGTHGRRGLPHALIGSVAEKIVRMARVPVLTVRGDAT